METTLEQRVAELEKRLAALENKPWMSPPLKKDWRSTIGSVPDSEFQRAAAKAGEEYRRSQTYEKETESRGGTGH
jgi:hypothetical protein